MSRPAPEPDTRTVTDEELARLSVADAVDFVMREHQEVLEGLILSDLKLIDGKRHVSFATWQLVLRKTVRTIVETCARVLAIHAKNPDIDVLRLRISEKAGWQLAKTWQLVTGDIDLEPGPLGGVDWAFDSAVLDIAQGILSIPVQRGFFSEPPRPDGVRVARDAIHGLLKLAGDLPAAASADKQASGTTMEPAVQSKPVMPARNRGFQVDGEKLIRYRGLRSQQEVADKAEVSEDTIQRGEDSQRLDSKMITEIARALTSLNGKEVSFDDLVRSKNHS